MDKIDEALAYLKEFDYYTPYQEVVRVIEDYIDKVKSEERIFYRCTNCRTTKEFWDNVENNESFRLFSEYCLALEDYWDCAAGYLSDKDRDKHEIDMLIRAKTFISDLRKIDSSIPDGIESLITFENGEFLIKPDYTRSIAHGN